MKKFKLIALALTTVFLSHAQEEISNDDYRFTMSASRAGQMELKLGQLAIENGESDEIKTLGKTMVEHHTRVNKELKKLADKRGIFLLTGLDDKQQKNYAKISEKKGPEFDRAIAKYMVKDHKDVIGEYQKEIKNGQDPELVIWAFTTISKIEQQVEISEQTFEVVSRDKSITYKY